MLTQISIRRAAWQRILGVTLIFAALLGAGQYWYQMISLDKQILALASSESQIASAVFEYREKNPDAVDELIALLHRHFPIIELYDLDQNKVMEETAGMGYDLEQALKAYPPHGFGLGGELQYRRLWLFERWVWQLVVPVKNEWGDQIGFFEGIYHLTSREEAQVRQNILVSVVMVVMATLVTGLVMYPLLLRLTRELEARSAAVLRGNIELMEVMGEAIARRDSDTNIHNYRVTLYALYLARAMGMPARQLPALVAGAFLHDVGKIGIPDAILLKPGKLSEDEFAIMKTHVSLGAQILSRASWLADARDIPLYHHEKYAGGGYMQGLSGEQIPLTARIFAVVDVFDALTAKRPYKEPMSLADALALLQREAGGHFDPAVVAVFSDHAAQWYEQVYLRPEAEVEAMLREQVSQVFSV